MKRRNIKMDDWTEGWGSNLQKKKFTAQKSVKKLRLLLLQRQSRLVTVGLNEGLRQRLWYSWQSGRLQLQWSAVHLPSSAVILLHGCLHMLWCKRGVNRDTFLHILSLSKVIPFGLFLSKKDHSLVFVIYICAIFALISLYLFQ